MFLFYTIILLCKYKIDYTRQIIQIVYVCRSDVATLQICPAGQIYVHLPSGPKNPNFSSFLAKTRKVRIFVFLGRAPQNFAGPKKGPKNRFSPQNPNNNLPRRGDRVWDGPRTGAGLKIEFWIKKWSIGALYFPARGGKSGFPGPDPKNRKIQKIGENPDFHRFRSKLEKTSKNAFLALQK